MLQKGVRLGAPWALDIGALGTGPGPLRVWWLSPRSRESGLRGDALTSELSRDAGKYFRTVSAGRGMRGECILGGHTDMAPPCPHHECLTAQLLEPLSPHLQAAVASPSPPHCPEFVTSRWTQGPKTANEPPMWQTHTQVYTWVYTQSQTRQLHTQGYTRKLYMRCTHSSTPR